MDIEFLDERVFTFGGDWFNSLRKFSLGSVKYGFLWQRKKECAELKRIFFYFSLIENYCERIHFYGICFYLTIIVSSEEPGFSYI